MSALSQPMGPTAASAMTNAPCDFFHRNQKTRDLATSVGVRGPSQQAVERGA